MHLFQRALGLALEAQEAFLHGDVEGEEIALRELVALPRPVGTVRRGVVIDIVEGPGISQPRASQDLIRLPWQGAIDVNMYLQQLGAELWCVGRRGRLEYMLEVAEARRLVGEQLRLELRELLR